MYKNVAGQKISVYAYNTTTGAPVTGDAANITAQISLDGGATAATNDTNPSETDATDLPGTYVFDMTQAETNANLINLQAVSATGSVRIEPVTIYTLPGSASGITADTVTIEGADATEQIRDAILADSTTFNGADIAAILTDTADMQPKLGSPAGASVSADIAAVKTDTGNIETDTQDIQSRLPAALVYGAIDASISAVGAVAVTSPDDFMATVAPQKNTAISDFLFTMVLTSDHYTAATGKTVTGYVKKDGAAYAALTNSATISEVGNGQYAIDLTADDLNGDVVTLRFTATGCDDEIIPILSNARV